MMGKKSTFLLLVLLQHLQGATLQQQDLRLSGGQSGSLGRLEVFDGHQWGTVCDDGWNSRYCDMACRYLNYQSGRQATTPEKNSLGRCEDLPILWDDVSCAPSVESLFQCEHTPGPSNCHHDEDVHCVCQGHTTHQRAFPTGVACDPSRHHITPYDPAFPWIGRAEVRSVDGSTRHAICDDFWDDEDAQVFCGCYDHSQISPHGYKAFSRGSYTNMAPLSIKYQQVHCTKADAQGSKRNIFHCNVTEGVPGFSPGCDVIREAAGVACGPIPQHFPPAPPVVSVRCGERLMTVCFQAGDSSYTLNKDYLTSHCPGAKVSPATPTNGFSKVCMEIDMRQCVTSEILAGSRDHKTYCYDVTYSQYDRFPGFLLTDTVWNRRACCQFDHKNQSMSANFLADTTPEPERVLARRELRFVMEVYRDASFSGDALTFPANVTRGQDLFAKVRVETWDDALYLVVPSCRFSPDDKELVQFPFWVNNCPRSQALHVNYFNLGPHTWGLQFTVPLFQNHQSLYMTCEAYVCDRLHDTKPYCDRSCSTPPRQQRVQARGKRSVRGSTHDQVHTGYLHVQDGGFGPLIGEDGTLVDVHTEITNFKVGDQVMHVRRNDLEPLPPRDVTTEGGSDEHDGTSRNVHDDMSSNVDDDTSRNVRDDTSPNVHDATSRSAGNKVEIGRCMIILTVILLINLTLNSYYVIVRLEKLYRELQVQYQ